MKINRIYARNFRKFVDPVTISNIDGRLTVISGDNEEGKSTIVHAVRSAFHLKYNTTATQQIQPYNSAAMPEVAIDFEFKGSQYQLRKVFGKKGTAELRFGDSVFAGSEAEEKLHEICNIGDKRESSIWHVLWVEQGTTFGDLKLADAGRRTLESALEKEIGNIVGGSEGNDLLKSIRELYLKWYTPTGKDAKNAEHSQAEERLTELVAALQSAEAQYQELQSMLAQLEEARQAQKRHAEHATVEKAKIHIDQLLRKKQEVEKHRQELAQAIQVERTALAEHANAASLWKQRTLLVKEADALKEKVAAFEIQFQQAVERHKSASENLHTQQQLRAECELAYEQALGECERLERLEQLRQLEGQIKELDDKIQRVKDAESKCSEIKRLGQSIKIDKSSIEKMRQLDRELLQLDAQLQAIATKLELKPANGPSESLILTERTVVPLKNWGEIIVTPGGNDLDKLRTRKEQVTNSLAELFSSAAVRTLSEAEELERKKTELGQEYLLHSREAQKLAPDGAAALANDRDLLQQQLMQLTENVSDIERGAEQLQIFTINESTNRIRESRAKRDAARQSLHTSKLATDRAEQDFRNADRDLQLLSAQRRNADDEWRRLTEKLTVDRQSAADEALFQQLSEAELRLQKATKEKEAIADTLDKLDATGIDQEVAAAQQKLEKIERELHSLRELQVRLEGSLQTLGKTGITEEVERLRGKKEQCEKELARAKEKAASIRLLYDTLVECEHNSKRELSGPLLRTLEPYMSNLFAGSKFEVDDRSLTIAEIQRKTAESIQSLSLGTREQISVLTRLAFAEVLSTAGYPAVVILDDALVYSDEARFAKMQELLKQAAEKFQIIVMTCRECDYTNMGVPIIKLAQCGQLAAPASSAGLPLPNQRSIASLAVDQAHP